MKKNLSLMLAALLLSCMAALGQNSNSNTNNGNRNNGNAGNGQKNQGDSIVREKIVVEMAAAETEAISEAMDEPLTPEQTDKILAINLDFCAKKKEAKDRNASEKEFEPLYKNRDDSLKVTLNPEQFKCWKENPGKRKNQDKTNRKEDNQQK